MQNHVLLITGATGGIGRAIGLELLGADARLILLGRTKAKLEASFSRIATGRVELVECDLTDTASIDKVGRKVAQLGRLDALVLSSGIYERSSDPDMFREQMVANVIGPYALVQTLLPMLLQHQGQIVFINSSQALKAGATVGQYAATMHAMKAVADSLRDEVNQRGVRVTTLFLGRTAGERQQKIFAMESRPYTPERLIQPSDVAQTVRYLLQMPRTAEVTDLMMRPSLKS